MTAREISKVPEVPFLSDETISLLTQLCFRENSKKVPQVELVLIFGTITSFKELASTFKTVAHTSHHLLITGGIQKYADSFQHELPESQMIYEEIKNVIPENMQVIFETKSRNTYENLLFGLKLHEKPTKSLCFIAKSFHCGRAYMTLRKFLPHQKIYQASFDPIYKTTNQLMTANTWHQIPEYRARIWGEFLRIKTYGQRGDLILDEASSLIESIDKSLSKL